MTKFFVCCALHDQGAEDAERTKKFRREQRVGRL